MGTPTGIPWKASSSLSLFPNPGSDFTLIFNSLRAASAWLAHPPRWSWGHQRGPGPSTDKIRQGCAGIKSCYGFCENSSVQTSGPSADGLLNLTFHCQWALCKIPLKYIRCDRFPEAGILGLMCWHSEEPTAFLIIHKAPFKWLWDAVIEKAGLFFKSDKIIITTTIIKWNKWIGWGKHECYLKW